MVRSDSKSSSRAQEENARLRERVEELEQLRSSLQATELYLDAKKKLLAWMGGILVILTLFGLVSINNVITTISARVEEEVSVGIVEEVKEELLKNREELIITNTTEHLNRWIEGRVEELLGDELLSIAEDAARTRSGPVPDAFAASVSRTYGDRLYYVIVATSPLVDRLKELRDEVRRQNGEEFDRLFQEAKVCAVADAQGSFALVIGPPAPLDEAKRMRDVAIESGFQMDSFIYRSERYVCDGRQGA